MTTPTPRFRPRLDRLEVRDCPAVIIAREGPTLFLTGDAADDWVAVCDEGLQVVEVQTERGTEIFRDIRRIVGNLGEGDDAFEFHQAATNPSNSLVVKVDLAAGDDRFEYRSPPPELDQPPPDPDRRARYLLNVQMGLGDDVMIVGPEYIPGLGVDIRADLGDGDDGFEFHQGERPMESLNVAVDLAAGDDTIQLLPLQLGVDPPDPLAPVFPAKWSFAIRAGFGNDVVTIQPCIVPGLDLSVVASLGDGDDSIDAALEGPAAPVGVIQPCISLEIEAGEGNDAVHVSVGNPNELSALTISDVLIGVLGFGGDDSGIIIICNVAVTDRLTQVVDLGAGDDSAFITIEDVTVGGLLKQSVNGGGNHDEIEIIINGRIGAFVQNVHTGEGDDLASLTWKACEILGPAVTRVSLGAGDDEATYFGDGHAHVAGAMAMSMKAGGGDDSISVMIEDSVEPTAFEGPVTLRVGLGDGDDLANLVVRDANEMGGPLTVAVAGGAGDDAIVADVDFTPRVRAEQLDPGNAPAAVLVALHGGTGLDTIDVHTEGVWNGLARFILRGGSEADDLGYHAVIGTGSTGALAVVMDGAAGDDVMAADVLIPVEQVVPISLRLLAGAGGDVLAVNLLGGPDTTPEPHLFVLDGGDGFDLARAPAGAVVRNCEGRA